MTQVEGPVFWKEKPSCRKIRNIPCTHQGTCSQVWYSTAGLSLICNYLKAPIFQRYLSMQSDFLGWCSQLPSPKPLASPQRRWHMGYVGSPHLLQFTVPAWSARTCGRDVKSLFSMGWFCSILLCCCIKTHGSFAQRKAEQPGEPGLKTSWN